MTATIQELRRLRRYVRSVEEQMTDTAADLNTKMDTLGGLLEGETAASLQQAYASAVAAVQALNEVRIIFASQLADFDRRLDTLEGDATSSAAAVLASGIAENAFDIDTITGQLQSVQVRTARMQSTLDSYVTNTTLPYREISGVTTLDAEDGHVNALGGTYTITLPGALEAGQGHQITIYAHDAGIRTIAAAGGDSLLGSPTNTLSEDDYGVLVSDGVSKWYFKFVT